MTTHDSTYMTLKKEKPSVSLCMANMEELVMMLKGGKYLAVAKDE